MIDYRKRRILEQRGFKSKFPPKKGYVVPLNNDRMFRLFCRDKKNKKFVAKLISLVTGIDFDLLVDRMIIIDPTIPDDNVSNHINTQDVIVTLDNTTLNLEMSSSIHYNKRKNERTAFKFAGNQYKVGSKYEDEEFYFYQICIENYCLFDNNFLINEVNMVNVTSGKYELETKEFKKYHINLKLTDNTCYNSNVEVNKFFKFFTLEKEEELEELSKGDDILMQALENLKSYSSNSILMSELEEQELSAYCWRLALRDAKNDGIGEGKKIGADESKLVIAKKMIDNGYDIQSISECTDLSIDQINGLIENKTGEAYN